MFNLNGLPADLAAAQIVCINEGSGENHFIAHSSSDSQSRTHPARIRLHTDEQSNPPTAATDQDWESVAESPRSVSQPSFQNSFDAPAALNALRQEFTDQLRELDERLNAQMRLLQESPPVEKDIGHSSSMVSPQVMAFIDQRIQEAAGPIDQSIKEFASAFAGLRAQREDSIRRSVAIADDLSKCKEKVEALELNFVGFENKLASELEEVRKRLTCELEAQEARMQKHSAQGSSLAKKVCHKNHAMEASDVFCNECGSRARDAEPAVQIELDGANFLTLLSQLSVRVQEIKHEVSSVSYLQKRVEALENTRERVTDDTYDLAQYDLEQVFQQVLAMQDAEHTSACTSSVQGLPAQPKNAALVVDHSHSGNGYYSSCESDIGRGDMQRQDSKSSFAMTFDKDDEFSDCLTKEDFT